MSSIAIFLLAFLGSFGVVVLLASVFFTIYRKHVREMRRSQRLMDPLTSLMVRRTLLPFTPPPHWMLIRSSNTEYLKEALGLPLESPRSWTEALHRSREKSLFLSPPIDGWSIVIGGALPHPGRDVDRCYHFLTRLSRDIGEIQFFAADRVLGSHAWALMREGRVVRAYAWYGETVWNEGSLTLDERLLGLRCRDYGEEAETPSYGENSPELTNAERVHLLSRRWGIDLLAASETILQQESWASEDDIDTRED